MKKKATRKATQTKKSVSKTAKKTTAQAKKSATKKADSTKSSKLKTYAKKFPVWELWKRLCKRIFCLRNPWLTHTGEDGSAPTVA